MVALGLSLYLDSAEPILVGAHGPCEQRNGIQTAGKGQCCVNLCCSTFCSICWVERKSVGSSQTTASESKAILETEMPCVGQFFTVSVCKLTGGVACTTMGRWQMINGWPSAYFWSAF